MSAPSLRHEQRVLLLENLADLAGYSRRVDVYYRQRPDVCRIHHAALSILVADAKASESPGNHPTRARLSEYARAALLWVDAGFVVSFAVCHDLDPDGRWGRLLTSAIQAAGHTLSRQTYAVLDQDSAVTAVILSCSRRRAITVARSTYPTLRGVR